MFAVKDDFSLRMPAAVLHPAPRADGLYAPVVDAKSMREAEQWDRKKWVPFLGLWLIGLPFASGAGFVAAGLLFGVWRLGAEFAVNAVSFWLMWGVLVSMVSIDSASDMLYVENRNAFISWLKDRYGIVYVPGKKNYDGWELYGALCYGEFKVEDVFEGADGRRFRLQKETGGLSVVEVASESVGAVL